MALRGEACWRFDVCAVVIRGVGRDWTPCRRRLVRLRWL